MKTNKSTLLKVTTIVALLTASTLMVASHVGAFTLIERGLNFPNVAIVRGQTARINVSNVSDSTISFSWSVFDNDGVNHLPPTEMRLEPGQSGYADLNADFLPILEGRQQIRALVKFVDNPDLRKQTAIFGSIEVFDNASGKTQFAIPAVQ